MDLWQRISLRGDGYGVHCGVRNQHFSSPESLAEEFGLRSTPNIYFEVTEAIASSILQKLLQEDMAYGSELMPSADAAEIARCFVGLFRNKNSRYFSNGNWHLPLENVEPRVWAHAGWTPATDATFDGGILAIGSDLSACVWFEDED